MTTTTNYQIGDLVYALINGGRGISLGRLVSRHDPEHWDVDFYPSTSWIGREPVFAVVAEADFVPDPYTTDDDEEDDR